MSITLNTLYQDTLNYLNEAMNSPAGAIQSGTGGTPMQATPVTIYDYVNKAAARIARSCWALFDTGTLTVQPPVLPGEFIIPFNTLTPGSYGSIWAARNVYYGAVQLTRVSRKFVETLYPTYPIDGPGAPVYWFPAGVAGIGIVPKPSAATLVSVDGLALPRQLVLPTDVVTWIDDDLTRYMSYYAASYIAKKNLEDASLSSRADLWMAEFDRGMMEIFERLLRTDSATATAYFPEMLAKRGAKSA